MLAPFVTMKFVHARALLNANMLHSNVNTKFFFIRFYLRLLILPIKELQKYIFWQYKWIICVFLHLDRGDTLFWFDLMVVKILIMKKLGLFCALLVAVFAFSSCEKDTLGVFNPKVKINKIYSESDGHYLKEQWNWNDNELHDVKYYKKNGDLDHTCRYQYENGRLTRIDMEEQHTDFVYEGKMLSSIEMYEGDQLLETYSLSFDKQKLSHISIRKYSKSVSEKTPDLMQFFSPGCESPFDLCRSVTGVKREHYDYSAAEIDFLWEENNVKDMKMTISRPDSIQKLTFTYVYDNNLNPKKNYFPLLVNQLFLNDEPQSFFCSANNAVGIYITDSYDIFSKSYSFTYAYDYYKKYPTKVYSTSPDYESYTEKKELLYSYEYLY